MKVTRTCRCGKEFTKYIYDDIRGKFCSRTCYINGKVGTRRQPHSEEAKRKIGLANSVPRPERRGENSPVWKGGATTLNMLIRQLPKYKEWRTGVFERDGWVCVLCREKGKRIQADHIEQFILIIRRCGVNSVSDAESCTELWNLDNGRTLCIDCHKQTPTYLRGSIRGKDKTPRKLSPKLIGR